MSEKTKGEQLREELLMNPKNLTETMSEEELKAAYDFCEGYKTFLDAAKTEREAVTTAVAMLEKAGYVPFDHAKQYKAGDKVYLNNRGKALIAATLGRRSVAEGVRIGVAHIDSPRLDLKPRPLYEEGEQCFLKTHYYGGIKKYQWTAIPLALHGTVVRKDGSTLSVAIGEEAGDPVFCVTDLLPHLAADQMRKTLAEGIEGEKLNILIGSAALRDDTGSEKVKVAIAKLLFEKYGIVEEDFISAELEAVPAAGARDIGLDRSMIGAYGHDDRVCAYAELAAIFDAKRPKKTAVCIFADKEEIGSEGVSGMQGEAFEYFMECLCKAQNVDLRTCLANSFCLSADVCAAFDPGFSEVFERKNAAYLNYGVGLCKYTGSGGKSGASDASSEVVGKIRKLLNDHKIAWQMCELGKTDAGGGGTVAKYMAKRNIDTLDAGVPVLSMHAPFEVVAKYDCYMTYRAVKAIFEEN